eukprot:1900029-Pyramimonas_sp.AAC.1
MHDPSEMRNGTSVAAVRERGCRLLVVHVFERYRGCRTLLNILAARVCVALLVFALSPGKCYHKLLLRLRLARAAATLHHYPLW